MSDVKQSDGLFDWQAFTAYHVIKVNNDVWKACDWVNEYMVTSSSSKNYGFLFAKQTLHVQEVIINMTLGKPPPGSL